MRVEMPDPVGSRATPEAGLMCCALQLEWASLREKAIRVLRSSRDPGSCLKEMRRRASSLLDRRLGEMRVDPVMEIKEEPRLPQGREKELYRDYDLALSRLRMRRRPYLQLTRRIRRRCYTSHGSRPQPRLHTS